MMVDNKEKYPSCEGAKSNNRLKNRYKDVLPCKVQIEKRLSHFISIVIMII